MSQNKKTVEKYMDGFNKSDHAQILSCLTDDVVWDMPGFFHLTGKPAFDKEIENDAFVGRPVLERRLLRRVSDGKRQNQTPHNLSDGSEIVTGQGVSGGDCFLD